jgi:hypothetical protein
MIEIQERFVEEFRKEQSFVSPQFDLKNQQLPPELMTTENIYPFAFHRTFDF